MPEKDKRRDSNHELLKTLAALAFLALLPAGTNLSLELVNRQQPMEQPEIRKRRHIWASTEILKFIFVLATALSLIQSHKNPGLCSLPYIGIGFAQISAFVISNAIEKRGPPRGGRRERVNID